VQAVHEHNDEYFVGLGDQFQTQVVPHGCWPVEPGAGFENPLFQQRDGLLDDPVFVLGCDDGKRLHAGVIDDERHDEPPGDEIGGACPGRASPPGDGNNGT
jgi:hypothetical protein